MVSGACVLMQLHESQIQTQVAEKEKLAAEQSVDKWMAKYVEELEQYVIGIVVHDILPLLKLLIL